MRFPGESGTERPPTGVQVRRHTGLFTALPGGLIAEVTRQGKADLSGGQGGLHDHPCPPRRARVILDKDVMKPLEETAAEQEQARPPTTSCRPRSRPQHGAHRAVATAEARTLRQ